MKNQLKDNVVLEILPDTGIGRNSTGTIDGITYYARNGKTSDRSAPTMPTSAYRQTITTKNVSLSNRYYSMNKKGLALALQTLAEQYVDDLNADIRRCTSLAPGPIVPTSTPSLATAP